MKNTVLARNCLWCENPIRGRSDKKFCDDTCRNGFNNHRTIGEYNLVRNINHALIRNRRILSRLISESDKFNRISRERLLEHGFQFKYCTHMLSNNNGELYYFCYDFGYHSLPHDWFLVIRQSNKL